MTFSSLRPAALAAAALLLPTAGLAGDPAVGERDWRQCRSCHMIVSPGGETIQRGGRVGPNLYGIVGQQAGMVDGFRYSDSLVAAGEAGLTWTEENFIGYVEDPTGFLRSHTGDGSIRSPMNFQMRSGAADMFAYRESLSE
jgi:cytochrome c